MAFLVVNNAVGWAQFQLNGGWKNTLSVLAGYGVIVGGIMVVTASIDPREKVWVYSAWTKGLIALQLGILILYATNRIIQGIRRDLTGAMIESNRLMPVPPLHAVVGYVFGAASQAISLAAVNFLLGVWATRGAGLPMAYWVKANLVVATFALFVWAVVSVAGATARGAVFWVIGPLLGFWFSGGFLTVILPALSVLATPTQGPSVFDARLGRREPALYVVPMLCQAAIAGLCIVAAMRKYRRSEDAAFNPPLALAMLACIVGTCTAGIVWYDDIRPTFLREAADFRAQFIGSSIAIMAFTAVVMCSIAWAAALRQRSARRREPIRRIAIPPFVGAILAAAIGTGLTLSDQRFSPFDRREWLFYFAGVLLAQALAIGYLARWVYVRVDRAGVIVVIWLFLQWLAPLVADLMIHAMQDAKQPVGTLSTLSPIGCLIAVFNSNGGDPRIGLAGQFAMALVPMAAFYVEQMRSKPKRAAVAAA
jgi:hypothetical protein